MKHKKSWHSLGIEEVFLSIKSSFEGLGEVEAKKRLKKFGPNSLPEETGYPAWRLLFSQFANPLMYIMLAATVISFYLKKNVEGFFVAIVMISNALVGFYQEHKANMSLAELKNLVKQSARVIRDNTEKEIDARDVVPGDVLVLRTGDIVAADGRILEQNNLKINEASLTGESRAVEKKTGVMLAKSEIADRLNMVFMGTIVEEGSANVLVLETGEGTQYGDIISLLKNTEEEKTALQRSVIYLSKLVGIFIILLVSIIAIEGFLKGQSYGQVFDTSLALFVSAIPEGLLPAITIILVLGMRRIFKEKGLVRRLAATETLGSITVICTDKTGTLTAGKMQAQSFITTEGTSSVDEQLLSPLNRSTEILLKASTLATDAYIENPGAKSEELIVRGSSTEHALVLMSHKFGLNRIELEEFEPVIDNLLFSSDRKYSATLRKHNKGATLYMVGAFEKMEHLFKGVISNDTFSGTESSEYRNIIIEKDKTISKGYRVIACAYKYIDQHSGEKDIEKIISKGVFLGGFIAITDPIRADVPSSFIKTREAGIKTVIVTGDNHLTALAVAKEIGLDISDNQIIVGSEIEKLSDEELQNKAKNILLFARVSPRHKLRIVQAFQNNKEVVAMFGDGVNDAPALKAADIGVAVGTRVAATREVADLVLLDGGFGTIIKAIEQGRLIFINIRRVFLYLVTQDFSQFFIFIIAILLGLPLPLLASQLLLINLVESGLPDLALTTEQEKDGLMEEPPRNINESLLNRPSKILMIFIFLISGIISFIFYFVSLNVIADINLVRTMMMVLLSMESLFLVFSLRSFSKSIFRKDVFSNRLLLYASIISMLMVIASVYFKPLQNILQTSPLRISHWLIILIINVLEVSLIDGIKLFLFKKIRFKPLVT